MELPNDHSHRMRRALLSLDGLSIGDGFGECFFTSSETIQERVRNREAPPPPWTITDDSIMALSIVRTLKRFGRIDQDALATGFAGEFKREPGRGYGGMARTILHAIGQGLSWKVAASAAFRGEGSCGNGGAMRSAPIGAYFADDYERAAFEARSSAEVTHAHPDGKTGAAAVAVAAAWMVQEAPSAAGPSTALIERVLEYIPETETFDALKKALRVPFETEPEKAASILGSGMRVIASDTVPFCLWCAARHPRDYTEALWTTVRGLGDRDTTCAIVGGIVALGAGRDQIPGAWHKAREPIEV